MKILYFYQYYSTPKGSWGTRVHEFARDWVKQGHEVRVITSIYSKSDLKASKFIHHQNFEGVDVTVINVKIDNKQHFIRRIYTFLMYAVCSTWYALTAQADVVIASSGPITVGIPGLVAHFVRGRKLVFEARDLWPEGAIELGLIKNEMIKKIAYHLEALCYKSSTLIVVLSVGMKQNIERRFGYKKVISVTNAANINLFATPTPFDGKGVLQPQKYLIYTGNIGEVNNSLWLLKAAKLLKEKGHSQYKILLIGEGQYRSLMQEEIFRLKLDTIIIWGLMPKDQLVGLIQNAVVSLVPLKGTPVLDTSSPNKFFESMAAGVPVVQTTQGWMKDFLIETNTGFTLDPDNPNSLSNFIEQLPSITATLEEMGKNAKRIAADQFSTSYLSQKMLNGIIEACR